MPTLERPTVRLHYEDRGAGDALVFLHGWCDRAAAWDSMLGEFANDYRCIAPDMRGHGGSGFPRDHAYFPEALSNDVRAVCEAAGVERPILMGHSFGGFLAAFTAMRFPGWARAIVVEDQSLALRPFAEQMKSAEAFIRGEDTHIAFRTQLFDSMVSPAMPASGRAMVQEMKDATPVVTGTALWAVLFEYTLDEIETLGERMIRAFANQPTLTIEAQPNPDYHGLVRSIAPTTRTAVIEGGHWIHLEHPAEFSAELRQFLAEV